ncbi:MAG: multicopper oxidase domain-containing protein [Longimicrobiales bacterium]
MSNRVQARLRARLRVAIAPALTILAGACADAPGADPYATANMDLSPTPASVSSERHVGASWSGTSLSPVPDVGPVDTASVKTVTLDATHRIIDLAPGVKFSAWTFGGQVPGPTVRVRIGDRVHFSMTNRSDEAVPGLQLMAAPMMHSMDFHAAMVSPQDKYRSVAPGQTITFEFTPNYPGVFMYHCGTPMVLEHIASGMYGAVIVEPRGGYPTHADREYVVIQSEFYVKPDPEGRKVDEQPLYVLDGDRLRSATPNYTVFNGVHNGMVARPLAAHPGERVRLFVLNAGPSKTSSFHVVGTIFDRVWWDGNPDNQFRGMQTVLLGSSSSAIVELMIPESGQYVMVDHHFANASQGAVGVIDAAGSPEGQNELEHNNISPTATPSDPEAVQGKLAFESKCLACHSVGGGPKLGPDLLGVTARRSDDWIVRWLRSPESMLASDSTARALLAEHQNIPMPNQGLTDVEIRQYLRYFHWADEEAPRTAPGRMLH